MLNRNDKAKSTYSHPKETRNQYKRSLRETSNAKKHEHEQYEC